MKVVPFNVNDYITDGTSAGRVTELVEKDVRWGTPGARVMNIGLEPFGGNVGMTSFIPDYLLSSWHLVPFEWAPIRNGQGLEERFVWTSNWTRLQREVRRTVMPTVDGIRGHLVTSPEEDEVRRRMALGALADVIPAKTPVWLNGKKA